jgi:hypothetical protein
MNSAALNSKDTETVDAAQRLEVLFKTYGNIAAKTITKGTSGAINLLQDLKGGYAEDVKKVGLTTWVADLEADNKNVEELVKARDTERTARTKLNMKDCRLATEQAYAEIVESVTGRIRFDGEEDYVDFVSQLNTLIDRYSNGIAIRLGQNKKKKKKGVVSG